MKKWLIILAAGLAAYIVINSVFLQDDIWKGFYYPDGCLVCEDQYIFSPPFDSKESCFDWADSLIRISGNENDTFECGLNCEFDGTFYVCEQTVD